MGISEKRKDLLRLLVSYFCEECLQHESKVGKLEAHRIKRGCNGGTYHHRNVKMVCNSCHKRYHSNEY